MVGFDWFGLVGVLGTRFVWPDSAWCGCLRSADSQAGWAVCCGPFVCMTCRPHGADFDLELALICVR